MRFTFFGGSVVVVAILVSHLLGHDGICYAARVDGQAIVMQYVAQPADLVGAQSQYAAARQSCASRFCSTT